LAAVSGGEISCWHADCFREAIAGVDSEDVTPVLQVKSGTDAHAITFDLNGTQCALAFDGIIFCPVVAVDRRQIKCVGVGCRSMERTCTHARLTKALPSFAVDDGLEEDGNESDTQSENGTERQPVKASNDYGQYGQTDADVNEIMGCMKGRAKRNLLPCHEELKHAEKWLRTADLTSVYCASPDKSTNDVSQNIEPPVPLVSLINAGMLYDCRTRLTEHKCPECGAEKQADVVEQTEAAIIYTHHATANPLLVCLLARCCYPFELLLLSMLLDAGCLPRVQQLADLFHYAVPLVGPCWWIDQRTCFQVNVGAWTCSSGHIVCFDGGQCGLFSLRKRDESGRLVIFTRGVCDELLSFVFHSRSTYTAATAHFSRTKVSFSQCRQNLILLGSVFVAMIQTPPKLFLCPLCGNDPDYIIIDGQALGFKRRRGMRIIRPALLVPPLMSINVRLLCILPTARLRRAVRKILRCSDELNKLEQAVLRKWLGASAAPKPRKGRRPEPSDSVYLTSAALFREFFPLDGETAAADESENESLDSGCEESTYSVSDGVSAAEGADVRGSSRPVTINDANDSSNGRTAEPVASSAKPWIKRSGMCAPALSKIPSSHHIQWSAARTFLLALFGDPCVGMFATLKPDPELADNTDLLTVPKTDPMSKLAMALQSENALAWHAHAAAADTVGFVANFLGRFGNNLVANKVLRYATGRVLEFAVRLEDIVDDKFKKSAAVAARTDAGLNEEYCSKWGGRPTAKDFKEFAATHPAFKGKDLDSIFTCFEYFGCLPRVRPAIFAHKAKQKRRRRAAARRAPSRRKRDQADEEDENDRCSKAFPKHKDLTAGVFNVVCPHVVTLGFRVMFDPESVSDALSVILERFPKLPEVVFYDVGCKLDRNALRRVRTIFRLHGVKVVLDRVHAKGHTCSPIFFPNESLGKTNGVATQAAEVQHSISVKFRTHLAYMAPETFMSHRVVQLALMNLSSVYKLSHQNAKKENEDADMGAFFHSDLAGGCCRCLHCSCMVSQKRDAVAEGVVSS